MDFDQIKQILDLVREHELSEFEIEHEGLRLKVRRDAAGVPAIVPATATVLSSSPLPAASAAATSATPGPAGPDTAEGSESDVELAVVKSPIVGTFYRSPEPSAPAFVEIGSPVKKGQVLCIIEAMKLMNEIESDVDGVIAEIYPQNAQAVEFGEPLFAIRVSG